MDRNSRNHVRVEHGALPLKSPEAQLDYEDVVAEFAVARDVLAKRLKRLGATKAEIAWHIANAGQRLVTAA